MKVNNKHYRTVILQGNEIKLINQNILPYKFEIISCNNHNQTAEAIKDMTVRGAGAIGATAAFAIAQAALECKNNNFREYLKKASITISKTRPTAQNLFAGINFVLKSIKNIKSLPKLKKSAVNAANKFANYDSESCRKIGILGSSLIQNNSRILTHCNAGWLAFVDWGTVTSPLYISKRQGKKIFVYVDETRPRNQGSRLTSWELLNEKIPHSIIADNASGFFMNKGKIDMIITGADRIAANGDIANKIGTYEKAVLAKENNIPFYIAAPTTTIDLNCQNGNKIPIEYRNEEEISHIIGTDELGKIAKIRIAPEKAQITNPAFDITPSKYITGIITEKGIIKPNKIEIKNLLNNFELMSSD